MWYRIALVVMILAVFAGSLWVEGQVDKPLPARARTGRYRRIVSMAPSITETLFSLGLGDRVVGVTRDCKYPPEVESVKTTGNIGGYYDPNFEALVARRPDLVIILEEHRDSLPGLAKLNVETLVVCHKTVNGMIESFRIIGRACGKDAEGERMAEDFTKRLDRIAERTRELPHPRVLVVLDRLLDCRHLADAYVAADDGYFDEIIRLAGGRNACPQRGVRYPVLSVEGILRLNPDAIVDLVPPDKLRTFGRRAVLGDWNDAGSVTAVKNHRVWIFDQDYAFVPGPRVINLVEDLARKLHPEAVK
jgi:iron complex transport system substrate-binding protein